MRTAYKQSTRVMLRSKQAVFFHSFQCFFLCSETSIYSFKLRFKCERQKKQCLRQFSIFRWKLSSNRTESLKYLRQLNNLSVLPKTKKKMNWIWMNSTNQFQIIFRGRLSSTQHKASQNHIVHNNILKCLVSAFC